MSALEVVKEVGSFALDVLKTSADFMKATGLTLDAQKVETEEFIAKSYPEPKLEALEVTTKKTIATATPSKSPETPKQAPKADAVEDTKAPKAKEMGNTSKELPYFSCTDSKFETFKTEALTKFNALQDNTYMDFEPFCMAYLAVHNHKEKIENTKYLTVIDYSKPNDRERCFVIDLESNKVVLSMPAGQGRQDFSNIANSSCSSLGLSILKQRKRNTKHSREGMPVDGQEASINNKSLSRGIYMHRGGGPLGTIGSKGCITVADKNMERIRKNLAGTAVYGYHNDMNYFEKSDLVKKVT